MDTPAAKSDSRLVNLTGSLTRLPLLAGFGGLLLLMAFAGLDTVRVFHDVERRNSDIRTEFLTRNHLLNEIRADLYVSGTYVRDYLLEPDAAMAVRHRESLRKSRRDMEMALAEYERRIPPAGTRTLAGLKRELAAYWSTLRPVSGWDAAGRRERGYAFLRDEVFPRRTAMLNVADSIARFNELQLTEGDREAALLFNRFMVRLAVTLTVTLVVGLLLAMATTRRVLMLERDSAAGRQQLQELSARLVAAQEDERRAISRELHDEVGQALSGLRVGLTNLSTLLPASAAPQAEALRRVAESTMGVVRNMTLLLRPSMLDDLGLVPALEWQGREVSRTTGLSVKVAAANVPDDLPDDYKTCVYRVVQEALNNCARHAKAKSVQVSVRLESEALLLNIEDDGEGFRPELQRGLGLLGMQERVTHLGGAFQIRSEPARGTMLLIALPAPGRP